MKHVTLYNTKKNLKKTKYMKRSLFKLSFHNIQTIYIT
jgi:hypothetical protein